MDVCRPSCEKIWAWERCARCKASKVSRELTQCHGGLSEGYACRRGRGETCCWRRRNMQKRRANSSDFKRHLTLAVSSSVLAATITIAVGAHARSNSNHQLQGAKCPTLHEASILKSENQSATLLLIFNHQFRKNKSPTHMRKKTTPSLIIIMSIGCRECLVPHIPNRCSTPRHQRARQKRPHLSAHFSPVNQSDDSYPEHGLPVTLGSKDRVV